MNCFNCGKEAPDFTLSELLQLEEKFRQETTPHQRQLHRKAILCPECSEELIEQEIDEEDTI